MSTYAYNPNDNFHPGDPQKFKMHEKWEPSNWVYRQLDYYGYKEEYYKGLLPQFINYWKATDRTAFLTGWNYAFVDNAVRIAIARHGHDVEERQLSRKVKNVENHNNPQPTANEHKKQ